jgi:calcineurin-like phosphoesterase family protein
LNTFLISDSHFGHKGTTIFMNDDGTKMRPWDNVEEMDEAMVERWNKVVRPKDKVYHLGDVVINRRCLATLGRLNGEKVLIKGNHDLFRLEEYTPYFKDIRGSHVLDKHLLTHVPIHPASLDRWECNIHGHLHTYRVMGKRWYRDEEDEWNYAEDVIDKRYFSVCVEQPYVDYTPIPFETVKLLIKEQQQ